jgi:ParB-like chromosome segregation protein Spo0J
VSHQHTGGSGRDYSEEEWVPIDSLLPADSPRLAGESISHAQALAASEAELPPIIVQRTTRRVIDGMHRLRAAGLRGQSEILVRFYDSDDEDAFIAAVETNIAHGLPLSQADRTAAATRIVDMRPQWSDRKVASVTGLAATTVGVIRRRLTEGFGRLNVSDRVGRDGKVRPLDTTTGRMRAGELITERPDAPIREIAEAAGVSPATALDVRNRLRDGRHPVPDQQQRAVAAKKRTPQRNRTASSDTESTPTPQVDSETLLQNLKRDPSLRFTDAGRALLRWLDAHTVGLEQWKQHADDIPAHCMQAIVELARRNSDSWRELAQHLEKYRKVKA